LSLFDSSDNGQTSDDSFQEDPTRQLPVSARLGRRHDAATSGQRHEQLLDAYSGENDAFFASGFEVK